MFHVHCGRLLLLESDALGGNGLGAEMEGRAEGEGRDAYRGERGVGAKSEYVGNKSGKMRPGDLGILDGCSVWN